MPITDYSTTAASNTAVGGVNIQGTAPASGMDNALRAIMADIATALVAGTFSANVYAAKASGYTVTTADRGKVFDCTATLELDLPVAATAGSGFMFYVKANGGAVTIDPNGTENINGASTSLVVANGASAMVVCTGAAWHTFLVPPTVSAATTSAAGVSELATDAEAQAKADTARTLTPSNLAALGASDTFAGLIELATDAEAIAKSATNRGVTPDNLAALGASETFAGFVELATTADAAAGTDTARAVTPAGLAAGIPALTGALAYGGIGTYVFGYMGNSGITDNTTYSGSSIEPAGVHGSSGGAISDDAQSPGATITKGGSALSGTWRAMGRSNAESGTTRPRATLFLRIS